MPGRHLSGESSGSGSPKEPGDGMAPRAPRVHHKLKKVFSISLSKRGVPWIHCGHSESAGHRPSGEGGQDHINMYGSVRMQGLCVVNSSVFDRQAAKCLDSDTSCHITFQNDADGKHQGFGQGAAKLRWQLDFARTSIVRAEMVDAESIDLKRKVFSEPRSGNGHCDHFRCQSLGMGCGMSWSDNSTLLVSDRDVAAHQRAGINGSRVSSEIWEFVLLHGSMITAQHIPGKLNTIADSESRIFKDNNNWKLCPQVFQGLKKMFPWIEMDLFADRLNHQIPRFLSWRPDPLAEGVDALTVVWREMRAYAFPPFNIIHRVFRKVHNEGATLLLVAPVWCQQPWYSMLLRMLIKHPVLIPSSHLLQKALDVAPHPMCLNQGLVGLASLRGSGKGSELSADATDLAAKAKSLGTTRAYKSDWKKSYSWYEQRQTNLFRVLWTVYLIFSGTTAFSVVWHVGWI